MIDMPVPLWIIFLFGGLCGYMIAYLIMELKYKNDKIRQIKNIVDLKMKKK